MAANDRQHLIVLDISANTEQLIQDKLNDGFVIQFMVNLQPSFNKILIVYTLDED